MPGVPVEIECGECSMMIFNKTGDEMQSMRVCRGCDQLIHEISYKQQHRRYVINTGEDVAPNDVQSLLVRKQASSSEGGVSMLQTKSVEPFRPEKEINIRLKGSNFVVQHSTSSGHLNRTRSRS